MQVAPRAGAWVETNIGNSRRKYPMLSHPVRVRGLKRVVPGSLGHAVPSHPVRVRGLKHEETKEGN